METPAAVAARLSHCTAISKTILIMAPRRDWDRARWDRLRAERGVEPSGVPSSQAPARKPAPSGEQNERIKRWQAELAAMPYDQQLEYLGVLRRRLRRLLASDDRAAQVIAKRFKSILKIPGSKAAIKASQSAGVARASKSAPASGGRGSSPRRDEAVENAIKQLVASRPGELSQKTCSRVLAGSSSPMLEAAGLHQAEQYGRLSHVRVAAVGAHVRAAIERGEITRDTHGMLHLR